MAKNKMQKFAELLGVELNEKFKLKFKRGNISPGEYLINLDGLKSTCGTNWYEYISELLRGSIEIVKLPWKPKKYEWYYSFEYDGNKVRIKKFCWSDGELDIMNYRHGFCYKTEAKAKSDYSRAKKFFASDEIINWED